MPFQKGNKLAAHRPHAKNGGRKRSAFTELKHRIESERTDDAEYAFALYVAVMRDPKEPLDVRLSCADWVSNRVLGKPKDKTDHNGTVTLRVVYGPGIDNQPAEAAPAAG